MSTILKFFLVSGQILFIFLGYVFLPWALIGTPLGIYLWFSSRNLNGEQKKKQRRFAVILLSGVLWLMLYYLLAFVGLMTFAANNLSLDGP